MVAVNIPYEDGDTTLLLMLRWLRVERHSPTALHSVRPPSFDAADMFCRPCTPRKRLQLAQEEDRKTSQKFTRETSIRDFSTGFVGTMIQTAVGSNRVRN